MMRTLLFILCLSLGFHPVNAGEYSFFGEKCDMIIKVYNKKFNVNGADMLTRGEVSSYLDKQNPKEISKILIVQDSNVDRPAGISLGEYMKKIGYTAPTYIRADIQHNK